MESKVNLTEKNPQDRVNVFSKLFLTWSFSLFKRGYKQGLTVSDLWQAREADSSGRLGDRLEEAWEYEIEHAKKKGGDPSLSKAIVRSFWFEYMFCGFLNGILFIIVWPLVPYTLAIFIDYFSNEKTPEAYREAHIYNFLMNLVSMTSAFLMNYLQLLQGRVGMRVRIACCSLMYRKILKLNHVGLSNTEPGQVINLMSNDVSRFDLVINFLHYLWVTPCVVPLVSYLVWQHVGYATLAALTLIFVQTIFVQVTLSSYQGKLRGKIAKRTDQRVKVMSELVNGVQVIKMYAWEKPFEKLVDQLRKSEVSYILKTSFVKGFSSALAVFTERFILFVTITTFVYINGDVRAQTSFSLVQYFNLLQLTCNIAFPMGLAFLAETKVSIRRLEEFLLLEEKEPEQQKSNILLDASRLSLANGKEKEAKKVKEISKPSELSIKNVTARWVATDDASTALRNITLTATPGEFVGVAGPVGAGKSSLLHLILGELKETSGTVNLGGSRISYASQEPWLFVGTVRENILFGTPYDRIRYKKVVKACALVRDFELLPHGDSTLVGERGISLSGGQRARIGLARACYRPADIYLLDDPLSAVDTHVGKHIVSECVNGILDQFTRILVTHQLHHLKTADKVIILRKGEIEIQGPFDEVSHTPLFSELLQDENEDKLVPVDHVKMMRSVSIMSKASTTAGEVEQPIDEEEIEEMAGTGRVPGKVYGQYFKAGASWCLLFLTFAAIIIAQAVTSFSDLWLTYWMNNVESALMKEAALASNATTFNSTLSENNMTLYTTTEAPTTFTTSATTSIVNGTLGLVNGTLSLVNDTLSSVNDTFAAVNATVDEALSVDGGFYFDHTFYVYIWAIAIFSCIIFTSGRSFMFLWVCMKSSINLHNQMFSNILGATMRFFDTNPSGRILNRFSKDMGVVDEILPKMYIDTIQIFMVMVGILVMVAIVNPLMLVTTFVCGALIYFWALVYLSTAQGIKRVEGITRSPVFSHVTATMSGLSTVRAFQSEELLKIHFDDKQDVHSAAWYLTLVTNTTFTIWLSFVCTLYIIVVAYTFLLMDDGTTQSGNVGLALSQGLILVNMVQYGVKQATEVVSQMTSVERVTQFTSLPQEKTEGPSPPSNWPQKGRIAFKDLTLRYDEGAAPVLKRLNIDIESGWKVGVVGRTGAGKSSLISALFRLAPIEGQVHIDEVETGEIALKELRAKISIIPQEPVLFSATLRYNMDPFDKHTDDEIWKALEQVELKNNVTSLQSPVASGGTNFSAGQRQLLCLARAALARNKLLVLDEATANVDPTTDALIQRSIRKHFAECTVITVAHRLHTVADSDNVVVMEAGEIVESGHPHELLQDSEGHFSKMVKQLGPASEQSLRDLASKAYSEHNIKKAMKE
uniref:ATP-binding cassette sub-family C member 4 n=1 Tax=Trichoplusia ni TaxID=7111 RepID=D2K6M7_TRINI|nr:ATP-binding cassette sub-family C member 4 [Trichoplusia ni]